MVTGSLMATSWSMVWATPCSALIRARSAGGSAFHSGFHTHVVAGPYVSVRPYPCTVKIVGT